MLPTYISERLNERLINVAVERFSEKQGMSENDGAITSKKRAVFGGETVPLRVARGL